MTTDLHNTPRQRTSVPDIDRVDRIPPHSIEAEQGVLGCVLTSPIECMGDCIEKLPAGPDSFYDLRHGTIYTAMLEMHQKPEAIDVITLRQHLHDRNLLDEVGGIAYLSSLPDVIPSSANLDYYLNIVIEKWTLRRIILTCCEAISKVYTSTEVNELVDEIESDVLKIRSQRDIKGETPIKELVRQAIGDIEHDHATQGQIGGIPTGFIDFDRATNGLQPGESIVIAARPSLGKSSWCANVVEHAAVNLSFPCGVISLEMSGKSIVKRLLCSRARVNLRAAKHGDLRERDFPKLTNAAGKIANAPIFIKETPGLSIGAIRAKARRWHREHKIRLLVVDYIQLAHGSKRHDSREREVAEISEGCKHIAMELEIPVIAVCQLNREVEKRKGGRPVMSDLRESGAIEQDADIIAFLYRPDSDNPAADNGAIPVNLYIAKNRNGESGEDIPLTFFKGFTRFESAAKIQQEDFPSERRYKD